jgi:SAM-dependent methyltransferase
LDVELAIKLLKRGARIFEVPVRYLSRGYEEGKKSTLFKRLEALLSMLRFWAIDDIYQEDEFGSNILVDLQSARRFNKWMADVLRPYLGKRVLEIGSGVGNLTKQFIPREYYVAGDINPHYCRYLESYAMGKPYLKPTLMDANDKNCFAPLRDKFDTVVMVNVLEHLKDEHEALLNVHSTLCPGGKAVILVPQHPALYGSLDQALEHRERYTREKLERDLEKAGFKVEKIFDFNRLSVPAWFVNGKVFRRKHFSRLQLKALELAMPVVRRFDRLWPWSGLSLIGIGLKA